MVIPKRYTFWCCWYFSIQPFLSSFSGELYAKVEVSNPNWASITTFHNGLDLFGTIPFLWKEWIWLNGELICITSMKHRKLRIVTCFFFWGYCKYSGRNSKWLSIPSLILSEGVFCKPTWPVGKWFWKFWFFILLIAALRVECCPNGHFYIDLPQFDP